MFIGRGSKLKKLVMVLMCLSLILSAAIVIPGPVVRADTKATYYVDPVNGQDTNDGMSTTTAFRTIEHARDVVRTINANMTDDIEVKLRGGTYTLNSTLNFTDADSGTNGFNIIYSAYNGEKPVISGGKQITGWTLYDASKNIYTAYAGGDIETRQLFVNGNRATRARSTGAPSPLTFVKASGYTATGNVLANSTIPMHNWGNKSDIEFVYKNQWTAPRIGVSTITNNGTTTTFTMKQPGWGFVTNKGGTSVGGTFNSNGIPWYIENAYELLDAEGEWYLDRATDYFYYKPRSGENLSTASVIVPTLEELVRIQGSDLDHKASNIQFKGVTFSYATYLRVNGDRGLPDAQNNVLRDDLGETIINAAINLKYAHSIKFERDIFEHLGGTGLNMYTGSQDNLVVGTVFTDISGNGIQVGDYTGLYNVGSENYAQSTDPRVMLRNNDINNSYFYKIGAEYFASTAIAASLPQDMDITHNEIGNVPYSGIHVGWGWGTTPTTVHERSNIQYNYIHDDMALLADGGAIYTNGSTNGSSTNKGMISNNYIQNEWNTNGALYPDEGSSWYDITDNVVNNSSRYLLIWKNTIHDIDVNNTYTTTSNNTNAGTNTKVTNTTVVSNGNWPPAALAIMDRAGIEAGYQDIIPLKKLFSITEPAPITVDIGTAKTAAALGLPEKVGLVTDVENVDASVTWDLNSASYDPTAATEQNFTVTGEITLPTRVINPNNVSLSTSVSVTVKKIDLAAHWKFDEGSGTVTSDSSGNSKTGTLNGGTAWVSGQVGNALSFNGTNSFVDIPDALNPTAYTVSLWVKPEAATAQNIWVRTDSSGASRSFSHQLRINSSGKFEAYMYDGALKTVTGTTTVQAGTWYHIALSAKNNGQMKLYVNGQSEGTPASINKMWTGGTRYWLASNSGGGFGWFKGLADDVKLYNYVLSDYHILLNSDIQPPTTKDNAPSGWVNQDTTVTLSASDNGSGVANTYYTVDDGAVQEGDTVVLSEEGVHQLVYWSVDKAGNVEQTHTVTVSIDKTAPEIAVTVPGDNSIYEDSGDLTPQITLTDNLSGVDSSKTTVTLDTYSYQIGTAIPLYTLPLGQHTLVVSSSDLVGNQVSKTVQFTTVASIDSLKALVKRFANNNGIDDADITKSLLGKLANNDLKGFMNDVKAQSGKHISSEAAKYLLRDAQYVLTQK
ncbi:LamG domain-containing protein [Paenibacillus sp. KQZ6P-2]|uniref:LamG domain-containing protein n=1 Tax=Paenibacillus mangrovi TaxID=2931978 RepID=A0A9X1WVR3_9BACL|nr:LamG domain-containing protein [Paenibacillus mangrovi]MCJ8014443.1 LamG domain-containing protein [Paenibacillus mangrovi]